MSDTTARYTASTAPESHKLADSVHNLAQDAHTGINAATEAAGPALERVATSAHQAVDNTDRIATNAADGLEAVGIKGGEVVANSIGYLRQHPVFTLSLAVAAGFVLSRLVSSR